MCTSKAVIRTRTHTTENVQRLLGPELGVAPKDVCSGKVGSCWSDSHSLFSQGETLLITLANLPFRRRGVYASSQSLV